MRSLTSTGSIPSSSRAGRGRPAAALLRLCLGKLRRQSHPAAVVSATRAGGGVGRAGDLGLTCKSGEVITDDDKEGEEEEENEE